MNLDVRRFTPANYSLANRERCESGFRSKVSAWSPTAWGCALAGEVGEMCELLDPIYNLEGVRYDIADEIGDVYAYLDLLCQRLSIDLFAVLVRAGWMPDMTLRGFLASRRGTNVTQDPSVIACKVAANVGHLCDLLKKRKRYEGKVETGKVDESCPTDEQLADYIAGTVFCLDHLATRLNLDLSTCIYVKWNKVSERLGYPVRLSLATVDVGNPSHGMYP